MNRRRLLAQIGAGSVAYAAGCLGGDAIPENPEAETEPSSNESEEKADDSNLGNTAVDDQSCPPYSIERNSAVCSHTVDADTASVYLDPSPDVSTVDDGVPGDGITLTLHNQSASDLTFNPYSWNIWYSSGTEWEELQQQQVGNGDLTVSAGDTHSWSFMEAVKSIQNEPELEPGLYAAELGVPDPENGDEWIACIALVQLDHSDAGQSGTAEFNIYLENRDDTDHSVTLRTLHSTCPPCQNDDPPCGEPCSEDTLLNTERELAPDAEESITGTKTAITDDIDTYGVTVKTSDGEEEHRSGLDEEDDGEVKNSEEYDFVVSDGTTIEIRITVLPSGALDSTVD